MTVSAHVSAVGPQDLSEWTEQVARELSRDPVGTLPSPRRAAEAVRALVATPAHPLADRVGPVWSAARTREQLGLSSRQALDGRRRSGSVLGVKASTGERYFPVSQFREVEAQVEVRPGLVTMFKVLHELDSWAVAMLLTAPAPELEGATPLEWERAGRPTAALTSLAARVRREWTGE